LKNWWSRPVDGHPTKPKWLIAALVFAAAVLPFLVFHYGFSPYHCVFDYCTNNRALWGKFTRILGQPIPARNFHTGKLLLENGKPFLVTPGREGVVGIVMRDSIPISIGWIGGAILPILLLFSALILSLKKRNPPN
jgi:hypothetical protein